MNLICLIKGHQYDDYQCVRCGKKRDTICFHKLMDKDLRECLAYYMTIDPWDSDEELAAEIVKDECYITPQQLAELIRASDKCSTGPGHMKEYDMVIKLDRIYRKWKGLL